MVTGSDPLNIVHLNVKKPTPEGGRVMFCPQVKVAKKSDTDGSINGGIRCGSPVYEE